MNNPWEQIILPAKDVNALRAEASHPLDLFWAKDHIGRYLFIYEYPSDSDVIIKDPPELVGVEIISTSVVKEKSRIILILKEQANWELFLALCKDLLDATRIVKFEEAGSTIILHRLRRWQNFLKKARLDILSEEKIKGLMGELLFLRNHVIPKFGSTDAVKFWLGPNGAPQDFNINDYAVEIKCQLGGSRPNVKISSADQLTSQLPKLYLFVITLGKTTCDNKNAFNLPSLISEIINGLEEESSQSLSLFQDLLLEAGYTYSQKYFEYNYLLIDVHVYAVTDGFPRICPDDLTNGILSLTYNIDLSECKPFEIDISSWELFNE